jgi:hypothetical protein
VLFVLFLHTSYSLTQPAAAIIAYRLVCLCRLHQFEQTSRGFTSPRTQFTMAQNEQMPGMQHSYTNDLPHDSDKTLERQTTAAHQAAYPHLYPNPNHIHPAFGGAMQPGLWKPVEAHRKFANPAPLGLCAFALTTFVLSCINMHARGETSPAIAIPVAFGYGGLVQLLAGMWYVSSSRPNQP